MLHAVRHLRRIKYTREQLKVLNAPADGYARLVGVDDTGKRLTGALSPCCLPQKVIVPREENPTQFRRAVEHDRVGSSPPAILLHRQDIHPALPEAVGDGAGDLLVHVQGEGHDSFPIARSFFTTGLSPAFAAISSAKRTLSWIWASSSAL